MNLRQSQSLLHTWSGLLTGWILFTVFLAGSLSFWRDEISRWTRPELLPAIELTSALDGALAELNRRAKGARSWTIELPNDRSAGVLIRWQPQGEKGRRPSRRGESNSNAWLDGTGRPAVVRATEGGDFFYRLHFDLHYVPAIWGRWIVGISALLMLTAIVSGVITHKKIFRDFFTFRPGKGQRSWLDGHNAAAVLALPFHFMITYTGLVTLMTLYMPWPAHAVYGSREALFAEQFPKSAEVMRTGVFHSLPHLSALSSEAEQIWGGGRVGSIRIEQPGDTAQEVVMRRRLADRIVDGEQPVRFAGSTGTLLSAPPRESIGVVMRGAMIGLHAGRFADGALRWLYFLSGLAGTGMVASGLVLWTSKRRERFTNGARGSLGVRMVERLNIAFIGGLPLAMTGFLWGNRLIPVGWDDRAELEIAAMFSVWSVALLVGLTAAPRRAWTLLFAATAFSLASLTLADCFLSDVGLWKSIERGDGPMTGMAGGFLVFALLFGFLAAKSGKSVVGLKGGGQSERPLPPAEVGL